MEGSLNFSLRFNGFYALQRMTFKIEQAPLKRSPDFIDSSIQDDPHLEVREKL
jgi:hypothetical protein